MRLPVPSTRVIAVITVLAVMIGGCTAGRPRPLASLPAPGPIRGGSAVAAPTSNRPNIVFVLTDDLSTDLIRYMPHVRALQRAGMTFTNYTVTDSLCCPSRSSIFTGQFPHNTGVFTNSGPDGGFRIFHRRGEEKHTFATSLQSAGYRTALMGKYLNDYVPSDAYRPDGIPTELGGVAGLLAPKTTWVPPGWTTWDVAGDGYREFDYQMNQDHKIVFYGHAPADYGVDVISHLATQFVASSARSGHPFFLETSTFAPHTPYTPAPRDADSFRGLRAPRGPAFDTIPDHAPAWLADHPQLSAAEIATIDHDYRLRVQSVQSVDRMIGNLEAELRATGQADNTVFIFSSDNGLHMGQYTLTPGKLTAFDTDVNVPLIVTGPHIPAGSTNAALTQNIDLAPTFDELAGLRPPRRVDGRSIVALLHRTATRWRATALIEHHALDPRANDPDVQSTTAGKTPTYEALRTARFTYVRYVNGEREFYDRVTDPYELDNTYSRLSPGRVARLNAELDALQSCRGAAQCGRAAGVTAAR